MVSVGAETLRYGYVLGGASGVLRGLGGGLESTDPKLGGAAGRVVVMRRDEGVQWVGWEGEEVGNRGRARLTREVEFWRQVF